MDPRDKTSSMSGGTATYKQERLQVYGTMRFSVSLGPCKFTNTRTEEGLLDGYIADSMLKLFSDFAKLL